MTTSNATFRGGLFAGKAEKFGKKAPTFRWPANAVTIAIVLYIICGLAFVPKAYTTGQESETYIGYAKANCAGEELQRVKSLKELPATAVSYKTSSSGECKVVEREAPADLGTFVVKGIQTLWRMIGLPPPRSNSSSTSSTSWNLSVRVEQSSRHSPKLQQEEEEEAAFTFGRCERDLGASYGAAANPREQRKIAGWLPSFKHHDVMWTQGNDKDVAGFYPTDMEDEDWTAWLGDVPGEIRTPSPLPVPGSAECPSSWPISEESYEDVADQVKSDRANPPPYNLRSRNCKHWADGIQTLAPREN